jgi:diadenosine tetraphosphate (Ap4A) HIT family hydrolase
MMRHGWLLAGLLLAAAPGAAREAMPALEGAYDAGNPFARIIRGEIPSFKVYEDAHVLAFMDIAPVQPGHVLVVSKTSRAPNLLAMDARDIARLMAVVQRVGAAHARALGVSGFTVLQNNGLGQSIKQVHFHVIPRTDGGPLPAAVPPRGDPAALQAMAARIKAAM